MRGPAGTLRVTVTVGTASSGTNRLQQVQFGAGVNAVIEAGAAAQAGNFTVTMPAKSVSCTFEVKRGVAGAATTVPLMVIDSCGPWSTFVGGGHSAF
jgi:hypothetical protein